MFRPNYARYDYDFDQQESISVLALQIENKHKNHLDLIPEYFKLRSAYTERMNSMAGFDGIIAVIKYDEIQFERFKMLAEEVKYDYKELAMLIEKYLEHVEMRAAGENAELPSYFS